MAVASIERVIRVGGKKWDTYVNLSMNNKNYVIYIPMLPKKPTSVSVEVREQDKKVFIRLTSSDGGICTCELDLHTLDISKCYNISCTPGATWVADQEILRSHIRSS
ncbi:MAG: hypothetical protein QXE01_00600 [Sulfolobales archaeon]